MTEEIVILQSRLQLVDPQDCTDNSDTLALLEALFDALVRRGPDGRYVPALAESWEMSDDARHWRFRLRPGLRFHDGTPLDAAAMRFSIARMQRPEIGATLGAPAVWGQYLGGATIAAPDPLTLTIETVEPCADLLDVLVSGYALPPHLADKADFLDHPVGSGSFHFESKTGTNEIRMLSNPDWWGGSSAEHRLIWREVPRSADRARALALGEAQVATRLSPADAATLKGTFSRHDYIDPTSIIFLLNAASGPFTDPRVRRAVNLATDRMALIEEVLGGAGSPLGGFVSRFHSGAAPEPADIEPDLEGAAKLLVEAGYGKGLTIEIDCPTRLPDEAETLTAALARQLSEVGISLKVHRVEDRVAYAEQVRDKKIHDMCVFDSSPMSTFRVLYEKIDSRVRGSWWEGYRNEEVEKLLDCSRTTVEPAAREALHRQSYEALRRDPPWLTLYHHSFVAARAGTHPDWRMRADGVLDVTTLL
ncbi:ABC transporter substrate-binding protein [Nisaea sediminum]|uniref:ABC transporter substrate-binding protein n=1 Tax=Nisaea sediminum TaxID=2775867 RepID=UPI0018693073|nr:ABC transporter substrate-binding protein [Nisaea sediminum]